MKNETLIERERIKKIVVGKCDYFINKRKRNSLPKRIKADILFLIDNPNYVRVTK